MVANKPVSIRWQIVFAFISILNFWAFYRIKKLRKAALYVFIPSSILQLLLWYSGMSQAMESDITSSVEGMMLLANTLTILYMISSLGFVVFSIYLIIKWSRQWNSKFKIENS